MGAEVAVVQRPGLGFPHLRRDRIQGRDRFGLVVRVVGECIRHNQQTLLIDRNLGIVMLIHALVGAVLHDPRVGVGEVVLIRVAWPWRGRLRWSPRWLAAGAPGLLLAFAPFRFIVRLLGLIAFLGTRVQHGFGL